jgi:hypothetical protein
VPERGSPARWVDPLKLVADVSATGLDGRILDQRLRASGVQLSMATATHLVGLLTVADTRKSTHRLVKALADAVGGGPSRVAPPETGILTLPDIVATAREAFLAPHETVPLHAAAGRIAGEAVAPYPRDRGDRTGRAHHARDRRDPRTREGARRPHDGLRRPHARPHPRPALKLSARIVMGTPPR